LRGRFHDDFRNVLFKQPCSEPSQFVRTGPYPPPFELVLALDFDIRHHHRQHLLVHIDSRNSVGHRLLLAGAESVPTLHYSESRATAGSTEETTAPTYSLNYARSGSDRVHDFDFAIGSSISPLHADTILPNSAPIFMSFRGPQAHAGQGRT
jgi:hypothetical protein